MGQMLRQVAQVLTLRLHLMARIGYARVSSTSQDLQTQTERLKAEGCEIVRSEKVSGASREGRSELATVLEFLRPGDELVVVRLDRLGRSTRDVLNLVHELDSKGAFLTVLEPHVTTKGPTGRMVLTVLGMVAEMELGFIKDRQRTGIEKAKAEGVYTGGKRRIDRETVLAMKAEGQGPSAIAKALGVSRMQIHRILTQA
jgi:DNA invertase Pin-like site-specific DNA recombinase